MNLPSQNTLNAPQFQNPGDEFNLSSFLGLLIRKKFLILGSTILFFILTLGYLGITAPVYQARLYFIPKQEIFTPSIIPDEFLNISKDSLFQMFLTQLLSFNQQKQVFETDFKNQFFNGPASPPDPDRILLSIHDSITLGITENPGGIDQLQTTYYLNMEGFDPDLMARFLNRLVDSVVGTIIHEQQEILKTKRDDRLRTIDNKISVMRSKAQKERIDRIHNFSEALLIAKNLNIDTHHFPIEAIPDQSNRNPIFIIQTPSPKDNEKIKGQELPSKNLPIDQSPKQNWQNLPIWYLYGAVALEEEIRTMKARTSDDSYIEELNQLEAQKEALMALDEKIFSPEFIEITQHSIPPTSPIKPKKRVILALGVSIGLFLGFILALLKESQENLPST